MLDVKASMRSVRTFSSGEGGRLPSSVQIRGTHRMVQKSEDIPPGRRPLSCSHHALYCCPVCVFYALARSPLWHVETSQLGSARHASNIGDRRDHQRLDFFFLCPMFGVSRFSSVAFRETRPLQMFLLLFEALRSWTRSDWLLGCSQHQ